jgi:hypothetical protein
VIDELVLPKFIPLAISYLVNFLIRFGFIQMDENANGCEWALIYVQT